jgi:hypothetical protein
MLDCGQLFFQFAFEIYFKTYINSGCHKLDEGNSVLLAENSDARGIGLVGESAEKVNIFIERHNLCLHELDSKTGAKTNSIFPVPFSFFCPTKLADWEIKK